MTARQTLAAYEQHINKQDFNLLLDLIDADATFWFVFRHAKLTPLRG